MVGRRGITAILAAGTIAGGALVTAAVTGGGGGGGGGAGCDRNATTATLATQMTAAAGGQTICLASGNYGNVAFTTSKAGSRVTLSPASGATVTLHPDFQGTSSGWTIKGFKGSSSIDGAQVNDGQQGVHDVTIQDNLSTGQILVDTHTGTNGMLNANILVDSNDVANVDATFTDGAILVGYLGGPGSNVTGVTVSNNLIHGGCSDGVQTGSYGSLITHNVIYGKTQGSCGVHVDCIQSAGSSHETWSYNVCYDTPTGLVNYCTETSPNLTIVHNAVRNVPVSGIAVCGISPTGNTHMADNAIVEHNISMGGASPIGTSGTGAILRNNVSDSGVVGNGTGQTVSNNLCSAGTCTAGTGVITGQTPILVNPSYTTIAGAALAAGSPGYLAGSDGLSMGVVP